MARCSRCGRENAAGAQACAGCGTPFVAAGTPIARPPQVTPRTPVAPQVTPGPGAIPRVPAAPQVTPGPASQVRCPSCSIPVPAGFRFCGACGTPIAPAAAAPPATRVSMPPSVPVPPGAAVGRRAPARARVVILAPDGSVLSSAALSNEETALGSQGEVRLSDPYSAPIQGRFVFKGHLLFYVPEKTPNGTFLLIKREVELRPGNEVRAGRQLLRVETFTPRPAPSEPTWGSPNPGYRFRIVQVLAGGAEGDTFALREGDNLLGRSAGDLSFPGDGYVSSRHAILSVRGEHLALKDIGSSNGTFVRLEGETNLDPGDLLLVGEQLLRVDPP